MPVDMAIIVLKSISNTIQENKFRKTEIMFSALKTGSPNKRSCCEKIIILERC